MSLTRFDDDHVSDEEETPFLPNQDPDLIPTRTPLPTAQICILLTAWLADSILFNSMSPYFNQLVRELPEVGGDARKVGYYTAIITSLRYAADAATSLQWNRLSDHVGRKPILFSSLVGATLAVLLFGLSRSFWALVLSRCLQGAMRGHSGVMKSMIAELTDETNVALGFSIPPVAWSLGTVIGPLIGGSLSRPQDHWPHVFSHPFWADYPYFLPCLVAASFTCLSLAITALYLEETIHLGPSKKLQHARRNSDTQGEAGDSPDLDMQSNEPEKPPPLRSVLTKPVIVTVANYAMLAFLDTVVSSYIPLVWSTPVEYGGLNLDPASIGLWLSLYGGMGGIFQFAFFSRLISRFGSRRVFVFSVISCAVIYAIFPFENLVVMASGGPNMAVWMLIILQLLSLCIFNMGWCMFFPNTPWLAQILTMYVGSGYSGTMNMYVSSAAPNKRSLGTVYGLSRMATSFLCIVGPGADWLFAFSLTHNVLGGKLAYVVLLGVVCVTLGFSVQLPKNTWARREDSEE
ncbi:MFS general substrate transporter [Lactarius hatsudake]|nr:MFS general substrate transporter [Lactarius hatsudake]